MPPQEPIQRAHLLVRADALHVVSAPAPLELDELVEVQARAYHKTFAEPLEDVEGALNEQCDPCLSSFPQGWVYYPNLLR